MIGFDGISSEVIRELAAGRHAREVMELTQTKHQMQAQAAARGLHRTHEGIGRAMLSIPPLSYHYWGQRLGYQCWDDKSFLAEFWRDNPGARCHSTNGKVTMGYRGENRRMIKSYG